MKAEDLEAMLGLRAPWRVAATEIDHEARRVSLKVVCDATEWRDPETGQRLHIHSWEERTWRHLDFWQYETVLQARVPRVLDPRTGKTAMASVPWAQSGMRWTLSFEAIALEVLRAARSVEDACKLLRLHWDSAHKIMERAVERGLAQRKFEALPHLGIDEKSFGRGHNYASVLTDIAGKRVLEVVHGANQEQASALLSSLPELQRAQVQAVAMDRSPAYIAAVTHSLPQALIVHDPFHLSADLNKAVDQVRRQEHRQLLLQGDATLTGTKYLWLRNPLNMSAHQLTSFTSLAQLTLKTSRAWQLKELFSGFYEQHSAAKGADYFECWRRRAQHSRLEPMKKVARSFASSLKGLLNWFAHPISNAMAEGYNSVIQSIKSAARGFRNFAHYRIRILFHLGKLKLSPSP